MLSRNQCLKVLRERRLINRITIEEAEAEEEKKECLTMVKLEQL